MKAWYVTYTDGFDMGMSPNDPEDCDIVMVFLSKDSAEKWIESNNAETWAKIMPCTVSEGHGPETQVNNLPPPYNLKTLPAATNVIQLIAA